MFPWFYWSLGFLCRNRTYLAQLFASIARILVTIRFPSKQLPDDLNTEPHSKDKQKEDKFSLGGMIIVHWVVCLTPDFIYK